MNFVKDNYYQNLPSQYQNEELLRRLTAALKTAIGITAPDFSWKEDGV